MGTSSGHQAGWALAFSGARGRARPWPSLCVTVAASLQGAGVALTALTVQRREKPDALRSSRLQPPSWSGAPRRGGGGRGRTDGEAMRASRRRHAAQTRIGADGRSNGVETFGAVGGDLKEKAGSPVELGGAG